MTQSYSKHTRPLPLPEAADAAQSICPAGKAPPSQLLRARLPRDDVFSQTASLAAGLHGGVLVLPPYPKAFQATALSCSFSPGNTPLFNVPSLKQDVQDQRSPSLRREPLICTAKTTLGTLRRKCRPYHLQAHLLQPYYAGEVCCVVQVHSSQPNNQSLQTLGTVHLSSVRMPLNIRCKRIRFLP